MYMIFFFTMNIFLIIAPLCSQPWVCTPLWSLDFTFSIDKHHQYSRSYNHFFSLVFIIARTIFLSLFLLYFSFLALTLAFFFPPYYYGISWFSFDWNVLIIKHSNLSYIHPDSFLSQFLSKSSRSASAQAILRSY